MHNDFGTGFAYIGFIPTGEQTSYEDRNET